MRFKSRSLRKFFRNKLAVASLLVILLYLGVAVAIALFNLIPVEWALGRVGPMNLPGFNSQQVPEKRLADAMYYLDLVDKASKRKDADKAFAELDLAGRKVVPPSEETMDEAWTLHDELADSANVNEAPQLLPKLEKLEALVLQIFPIPTGADGLRYKLAVLLGTDRQGRSNAFRALYSVKVAIQVGFVTSLISVLFGSLLGAAAAFYGGWVDHLVIWLYSTLSSIPNLVLLSLLAYMFTGSSLDNTLVPIYVAFCLTFWIGPCRVVRGETLKLKELEYVHAAVAIGFSRLYILLRHVLPNTAHLMFINFSLLFIGAIKSEVILSFLGLGVKTGASWGIMISQSAQEVVNGIFWQINTATVFMFILVLAFNILTDALQDAFDPKHVG